MMNRREKIAKITWVASASVAAFVASACGTSQTAGEEAAGKNFAADTVNTAGSSGTCDWPQAFGTPSHAGKACPELHNMRVVQQIVQDEDAHAEIVASKFLQIHESPVVTSGDMVIIGTKNGFTKVNHRETEKYHVTGWQWFPSVTAPDAHLDQVWSYDTDWQPIDAVLGSIGIFTNGYVQQFGLAISGNSVFVPAAHGKMVRLSLTTGAVQQNIDPFQGTVLENDARLTVTDDPSVGPDGKVYYGAVAWPTDAAPFGKTPRGSYLVQVGLDGTVRTADWSPDNTIMLGGGLGPIASSAVGVVTLNDLCEYRFGTSGTPLPTGPDSKPPMFHCGAQRPAMNAPFAFTPSGNLVVFSYANNAPGAGYLIEVNPNTMQPVNAANLRKNQLFYGCGVRVTNFDAFPNCQALTANGTTNLGVDPDFNDNQHPRLPGDIMDNAPVVSPDGQQRCVGWYDGGFSFEAFVHRKDRLIGGYDARGSLACYNSDGSFHSNNPRFGWEVTPSAMPTPDGGFRWLQDENLYSLLNLKVAVNDQNMNPISSGGPANPQPFEDFVDTHITFDTAGNYYAVAESGHFFKFDANSQILEVIPLTKLNGSLADDETLSVYTAVDSAGRRYVPAEGLINVIASSDTPLPMANIPLSSAGSTLLDADADEVLTPAETPEPGPPVN